MDVMKAVNVAGNPWTRSMALVNVSMSDAVNSVQNRYSRYTATELPIDPNASAEAAAAACTRNSHAPISRPEGADRYSLCGDDANHSGQPCTGCGYCFRRKSCGRRFRRTSERRDKRARHLPPAHHAHNSRRICGSRGRSEILRTSRLRRTNQPNSYPRPP